MSETATMDGSGLTEDISQEGFWRANFPNLTLHSDNRPRELMQAGDFNIDQASLDTALARLGHEGYFQGYNHTFAALSPLLAEAVQTCVRLDIPPAFIFLFDEVWECFRSLQPMVSAILGPGYKILPDFWVWHVDGKANESGWRPHRDKGRHALAPDGSPLSLSIWAPFLDATPLTSCMYLLPINKDPVYNTADEDVWNIPVGSIRALPGKPGDYFCWNQAVLHWGSQSSPFAPHPRISVAMEFQRGDAPPFNLPLIDPTWSLDFPSRLKMVAKQILQYAHMYQLPPRFEALGRRLLGG